MSLPHSNIPTFWMSFNDKLILFYSLWSKILATRFLTHKIFHSEFQNWKKTTQALSVYRKGTFCAYIKCLIVISWKVMIKSRGLEKRSYFGVLV